jgi:hypothetical protein
MKRFLFTICLVCAIVTGATAQKAAERKAEIRKGLKEQVMLTDSEIDAVLSIEESFRPKIKEVKADASLSESDKTAKIKALNEEKAAKVEATLGKEKASKVAAFYAALKHKDKGDKKNPGKKKDDNDQNL